MQKIEVLEYAREVSRVGLGLATAMNDQAKTLEKVGELLKKLADLNDKLLEDTK